VQTDDKQIYSELFWEGFTPDPILTVSEWADTHRILSQKSSSEPGQWRTSRTPYLKEIMDCLSSSSMVEEVVFIKGAQIGGTEAGNNWMGYIMDHAPGPMMAVQPTVELAKRNSKQRIAPLIEESPRLKGKVKEARSRDSGNTILEKDFPGGRLVMTGANSAVGLRSMPVRYLFLDEVDAYPGDVDGEGEPVELARARTRSFARKKVFLVSTPTLSGRSRIEAAYDASDKRRYFVPCPYCNEFQFLKWSQIKWPDNEPEKVVYICEHCEKDIEEHHKTQMFLKGEWRAETPGVRSGRVAGFHINSLYSPLGWFSWREAVELWQKSQSKPEMLKGFINTVLGETWKDKGDAPDWQRLYDRRETYAINKIPAPGIFLTAGVDVQKDRLEVEVVAWGKDKQSWSIDYRVISGDSATELPWKELDKILMEEWLHESGHYSLKIQMLAVDSGFNTQHVYNWARKHPMNRVMAVKGIDGAALMVGQPSTVDVTVLGRKIKRGFRVWPVGSSIVKNELYSWLRLDRPVDDGGEFPPGFCHFPQYGDEFFKQLTGEQLVVKIIRGYRKYEWEKIRDRNEALDCRVYARAAANAFGMDRFSESQWNEILSKYVQIKNLKQGNNEQVNPVSKKKSSFW